MDDGSTDGSGDLCDAFEKQHSCVKALHKENGGLMSAWIAGVEISRGDYLCFVDSDDWVETEMIREMAVFLTGSEKEIVVCNHSIDRENGGRKLQENGLAPGVYEGAELREVKRQLLGNEIRRVSFSRCMKLIAKELILKNLNFCNPKIRMGEDLNIMLPALLDTERLVIMKESYFYHYYYNQSSMVHKYDKGLYENVKLLRQIINQVLSEKYKDSAELTELLHRADMETVFLLMLVLKNEARGNRTGYQKNIREVCRQAKTRELLKNAPVRVESNAGRLLYLVMKHPNRALIWALRLAMEIYYK